MCAMNDTTGAALNATPDKPDLRGRGGVIIVRADSPEVVTDGLELRDAQPCNWASASAVLADGLNERTFVSGAIDGWVCIAGRIGWPDRENSREGVWKFLEDLSARYGDAQYYEYMKDHMIAWARAVDGKMLRAYCFIDDDVGTQVLWNDGEITEGERRAGALYGASGFKGSLTRAEAEEHPDCCYLPEDIGSVMKQWSVDVQNLDQRVDLFPSVGYIGTLNSFAVKQKGQTMPVKSDYDATPDKPVFRVRGNKWIAVRCDDPGEVVDALDMDAPQACNWQSGMSVLKTPNNDRIFVSGVVDGWVAIAGIGGKSLLREPDFDKTDTGLWTYLEDLSRRFGEAQYFSADPDIYRNAWAVAKEGRMVRAYCYLNFVDEGVLWNEGAVTEGERRGGYVYGESGFKGILEWDEPGNHADCCHDDAAVGAIAAQWSVNFLALGKRKDLQPSTGFVGKLASLDVKQRT